MCCIVVRVWLEHGHGWCKCGCGIDVGIVGMSVVGMGIVGVGGERVWMVRAWVWMVREWAWVCWHGQCGCGWCQ